MEERNVGLIVGLITGLIVGVLVGALITEQYYLNRIEELGESICEEEYGMDYESYVDRTLKCKPFKETYDGIRVEIGGLEMIKGGGNENV